ncbi:glutamate receptor-like isoform X4 [Tachypleus tridentatus]|uniref:glutamate receptor-like isoform X4 n=1 Tax=Tachypleus tridentatus TaxID=6853 RepID=UPI003FD4E9D3
MIEVSHLRVAVEDWVPWVNVEITDENRLSITGPMGLVFDHLSKSLGLSFSYVRPFDHKWGSMSSNGSFSGMIGMLQRNEVDIAVGPFAATYDRFQVTRFSTPIYNDNLRILTGRPQTHQGFFSFWKALHWKVWAAIFVTMLLMSFIYCAMNRRQDNRIHNHSFCQLTSFFHHLWQLFRCLFYQGFQMYNHW